MDLSALIFVALAVAWAVYLVPKALKHHEESVRNRSAERFATRMRVLASRAQRPGRERHPGRTGGEERVVVAPGRVSSEPEVTTKPRSGADSLAADRGGRPDRAAARAAARRRRRVLGVLTLALVTVGTLAMVGVLHPAWVALPAVLVLAWLALCRAEARRQQRVRSVSRRPEPAPAEQGPEPAGDGQQEPVRTGSDDPEPAGDHGTHTGITAEVLVYRQTAAAEETGAMPRVEDAPVPGAGEPREEPAGAPATARDGLWDPQPMTLPTYVSKPAAHPRSPRGIDPDDTGVWTSGRTEADAALAREAEEAERAARDAEADRQQRRTGS